MSKVIYDTDGTERETQLGSSNEESICTTTHIVSKTISILSLRIGGPDLIDYSHAQELSSSGEVPIGYN